MSSSDNNNRAATISAIGKPIQLAALIVLVIEGLLAYLVTKASPADVRLYVCLMLAVLVITFVSIIILEFKRPSAIPATGKVEEARKSYTFDVFLAAPMAALSDDNFKSFTTKILEIKKTLEVECGFLRIFYAGNNMSSQMDFEAEDVSIETDVNALKESQYFIMIYPEKIVSSVLFEAGIALALGKPSFYFGHIDNFPFLMKQANQKFNFVRIQEADSLDKINHMIRINKRKLFEIK
jgi:hypothetical protein